MSRSLSMLAICSLLGACSAPAATAHTEGAETGATCQSNDDCGSLEFCNTEASGTCGATGVCTARGVTLLCMNNQPAVCGCDGNTYNGSCLAHKAGTSVAYAGACQVSCWTNDDCDSTQFCKTPDGQCGGQGACAPRGLTLDCIVSATPVCGCDGNTYPGACEAAKAGVAVDTQGACPTPCFTNDDCGSLQYCATDPGQCGSQGTCQPRGINLLCVDLYTPVCGCDGNTYANDCQAHKAGVAVDFTGTCN